MRDQLQADRQQPQAKHRQKPEQPADQAEDSERQPVSANCGVTRPANDFLQADPLLEPIQRAVEQVPRVFVVHS
jgi:hypothetical protein